MFTLFLAAAASDAAIRARYEPMRQSVREYCRSKTTTTPSYNTCIAQQNEGIRVVMGTLIGWRNASPAMQSCMTRAKVGKHINWTNAANCARTWRKSHPRGPYSR